jgi:hypothetical protein
MKTVVLILLVLFVITGCATTGNQKPSVCDTIPEGQTSVICDLAKQVGQRPETVAGILKLGNVAALAGHLYTAQEASLFIDIAINHLEMIRAEGGVVSYTYAVQYILNTLSVMSPEAQAVFIILEDFMYFDFGEIRVLSDFDIGLLLKHLNDQKLLLAPFLLQD